MKFLKAFVLLSILSTSAWAQDYYGAIAFDIITGQSSESWDFSTRTEAERVALRDCAGNCRIAVWFKNSCGALAQSSSTGAFGWAHNTNPNTAESKAISQCQDRANDCQLIASACTTQY